MYKRQSNINLIFMHKGKTFKGTLQILKTDKNITVIDNSLMHLLVVDVFIKILITDVPAYT